MFFFIVLTPLSVSLVNASTYLQPAEPGTLPVAYRSIGMRR